ncbi:uncharacterized protein LOC113366812 [Ctenocephalides felis]|uniref:uncharacterized protein LOC113366812 n=1 Tax=Ctenocephalides felis TaxID=7515 RepID=UPI000E6E2DDB|nr:uncharacterized protein LOC113366812 [Ctenocephalides felis]
MVTKVALLVLAVAVAQVSCDGLTWKYHPSLSAFMLKGKDEMGKDCSAPGEIKCQDCETANLCIAIGADFLETTLETCPSGMTCKPGTGCVRASENTLNCPDQTPPVDNSFVCESIGIFPDLEDCKKFHFCIPNTEGVKASNRSFYLHSEIENMSIEAIKSQTRVDKTKPRQKSIEHTCDRGYGYDPMTAMCSIKLDNGECANRDKIQCKAVGESNALSLGSSYFYVCHRVAGGYANPQGQLVPRLYRCPHGEFFFKGSCIEQDDEDEDNLVSLLRE